ncbi:DMT family transporter [Actinoplanes sp. NPDC051346]|uniref:DMT family transporter n=1 Tax=Actinoplanes sp. NPDC051346 TaxID=3155048 RepID=UPI003435DB86
MTSYRGAAYGIGAMTLVGSSAAVLAGISDYPTFGGQLVRYAGATLVLLLVMRVQHVSHLSLSRAELGRLTLLAATGLAGFNVCYVQAVRYADPSSVGAVVGGVPIVLAVMDPMLRRRSPSMRIVAAALVVAVGVAITQGYGGGSLAGLSWSLGALGAEVAFSLLAVPVLPRLGPIRVSTYASALAVPVLLIASLVADGRHALPVPTQAQALSLLYLAVVVTAWAFVLWYAAISRLGADRAGLSAGVAPASAVVAAAVLGTGQPSGADVVGAVIVGLGVVIGLAPDRRSRSGAEPSAQQNGDQIRAQRGRRRQVELVADVAAASGRHGEAGLLEDRQVP